MSSYGEGYSSEERGKFVLCEPEWTAAYESPWLFHLPAPKEIDPAEVVEILEEVGIGWWSTRKGL